MFKLKKRKLTISEYAKKYNDSSKKIEQILINIGYIKKQDRWTLTTNLGKLMGIEELYNPKNKSKFVLIPDGIHTGKDFKAEYYRLDKCENLKNKTLNKKQKMTNEEKGFIFEKQVEKYFIQQGYKVYNHSEDKGKKDHGIDLMMFKQGESFIFIQCKNWDKRQIRHKEIKITRMDVIDYLEENMNLKRLLESYKTKIIYATSKDILHQSAKFYLEKHKDKIEHIVIPYQPIN